MPNLSFGRSESPQEAGAKRLGSRLRLLPWRVYIRNRYRLARCPGCYGAGDGYEDVHQIYDALEYSTIRLLDGAANTSLFQLKLEDFFGIPSAGVTAAAQGSCGLDAYLSHESHQVSFAYISEETVDSPTT